MTYIKTLLFLALILPTWANELSLEERHCLSLLARAALSVDANVDPTEKEHFHAFKNSAGYREFVISEIAKLRESEGDEEVLELLTRSHKQKNLIQDKAKHVTIQKSDYTKLIDDCDLECDSRSPNLSTALNVLYAQKVLLLNKGDSIEFPNGKSFKLGNFLGRGDSNHVFEIEGSEEVLKIPFTIEEGFLFIDQYLLEASPAFVELRDKLPKQLTPIEIRDHSLYYVITKKLNARENGTAYLDYEEENLEKYFDSDLISLEDIINAVHIPVKTKELLEQAYLNIQFTGNYPVEEYREVTSYELLWSARQFLFDESQGIWIIVDWDQ